MSKLKAAIIGCGWVSDWHVRDGLAHIPDQYEVTACCDVDQKKADEFGDRYGIPLRTTSYDEILKSPDVDVVILCTPPSLHYSMSVAALEADKHVACEKPLVDSLRLVDALIEAESRSKRRIMPIFQYRFGDGLAKVQHVIRSGLAGRHFVGSFETAKRREADYYSVPWRGKFATELGGVLLTQAIHIHDIASWLLGPASLVSCFKETRVNKIEVEDCAVASLKMEDGSLVSFTATLGSARQVTRIRLCFQNVTFEKQCYDEKSMRPADGEWEVIPMNPEIGQQIQEKMREVAPAPNWFAGQYALFHDAVVNGRPLPVSLEDARRSLELVTALFHSNETGCAVRLPIGPDHPKYDGWVPQNSS
jgi:predicted dehydrogenase